MTRSLFSASGGSLADAARWLVDLVSGQVVTALAVIAVAFLGYEMLFGRIALKAALRVVLGCFVLLGSATIARGLIDASRVALGESAPGGVYVAAPDPAGSYPRPAAPPAASGNPFDPYAGGSPPH